METCQKLGSANDASNLTWAIEMFLASEKRNPSEYPVGFICKHGDVDMFKTFIKLAKFDRMRTSPYWKTNWPLMRLTMTICHLVTKMEFRISLFENFMAQRDQKHSRIQQPFQPPEYSSSQMWEKSISFWRQQTDLCKKYFLQTKTMLLLLQKSLVIWICHHSLHVGLCPRLGFCVLDFTLNPLRFSLTRETDTKMTRAKSWAIWKTSTLEQ